MDIKYLRNRLRKKIADSERILSREKMTIYRRYRQEGRRSGLRTALRLVRRYINEQYSESSPISESNTERMDRHG